MSRKRGTFVFCFLIAVAILLLWFFWGRQEAQVTTPTPSKVGQSTPNPPRPVDDNASKVDRYLKKHRMDIAGCLMGSKAKASKTLKLTLTWDALGNLHRVDLAPDLGADAKECLSALIKPLNLVPSADHAPFSFSKQLSFQW